MVFTGGQAHLTSITDSSFHPSSHCLSSHLPSSLSSPSPQHPAIQLSIYQPTQDFNSLSPDTLTHPSTFLPAPSPLIHTCLPHSLLICAPIHPPIHPSNSLIHPSSPHPSTQVPTTSPPTQPSSPTFFYLTTYVSTHPSSTHSHFISQPCSCDFWFEHALMSEMTILGPAGRRPPSPSFILALPGPREATSRGQEVRVATVPSTPSLGGD